MRPGQRGSQIKTGMSRGVRLRNAVEVPGASMNDLTDPSVVESVSGNAVLNGVPVTVAPVTDGPA